MSEEIDEVLLGACGIGLDVISEDTCAAPQKLLPCYITHRISGKIVYKFNQSQNPSIESPFEFIFKFYTVIFHFDF